MYESSRKYQRKPEERIDQKLSWNRSDRAFFAAGACHILAFAFMKLHPKENNEVIFLNSSHVYVSNGKWAFDFNGWNLEEDILEVEREYVGKNSRVLVRDTLQSFCVNHNHRLPEQYYKLPWKRAYRYIRGVSFESPDRR